ncbi:MAG: hypothetical protein EBZ49_00615 [Proteobacteria bacterium]|nr:hypothetical protein [Pseudomonadota bacterium]
MTEVTLSLTDKAFRVLKGYATLSGKPIEEITTELSELVSTQLERELTKRIALELDLTPGKIKVPTPKRNAYVDTTEISDGLGDIDDSPEPEQVAGVTDEAAFVPKQGGVSDADLDNDMRVEDPNLEAKADAPIKQPVVVDGESLFAEVAGFTDPWAERRRPVRGKRKGKVTPLSADSIEEGL